MKPFPWKCEECGEHAVYADTLENYTTSMDHDGRSHQVTVTSFEVAKCRKCGAVTLDGTALRRLSDALRSVAGLLQPTEIRSQRESLNLTQKELARYLQIAEGTLSRWETGAQIQQRSMDKLLRLFFDLAEVRRYLKCPEPVPARPSNQSGATSLPTFTLENPIWIPVSSPGAMAAGDNSRLVASFSLTKIQLTPSQIQQAIDWAKVTVESLDVAAVTDEQTPGPRLAA